MTPSIPVAPLAGQAALSPAASCSGRCRDLAARSRRPTGCPLFLARNFVWRWTRRLPASGCDAARAGRPPPRENGRVTRRTNDSRPALAGCAGCRGRSESRNGACMCMRCGAPAQKLPGLKHDVPLRGSRPVVCLALSAAFRSVNNPPVVILCTLLFPTSYTNKVRALPRPSRSATDHNKGPGPQLPHLLTAMESSACTCSFGSSAGALVCRGGVGHCLELAPRRARC